MQYSVEIKQLVRFPYCRVCRSFVNQIISSNNIRKRGVGHLYSFMVLFSLANYRTSTRYLEGQKLIIKPGEWVALYPELCQQLGLRYHYQLIAELRQLQDMRLISFTNNPRCKTIQYKICCWSEANASIDLNAPCQKDTGFFFFPMNLIPRLISTERCSEADIILDLWLNAVYNDDQVCGSTVAPVVYYRNGSRTPLLNYDELAKRWHISKATVHRVLKKLAAEKLVNIISFPGRIGSIIYLANYLSTMFCVSDPMPTKEDFSVLFHVDTPSSIETVETSLEFTESDFVSEEDNSVSNPNLRRILGHVQKTLYNSGFFCFSCKRSIYRLSSLSDCREGKHSYALSIHCGDAGPRCVYGLTVSSDAIDIEEVI